MGLGGENGDACGEIWEGKNLGNVSEGIETTFSTRKVPGDEAAGTE